ncbi:MAG TPA: two-component regulator propeller domain-containing protein [Ignavibacteria bacterium]|nr:two-component regulator propeller domain-containing protein [Ignavibacteria bacterium]
MIFFEDYKFEKLSINDGLSQSTVYSIDQDKKGFMWISTQQGLNKFDGYKFTVYTKEQNNIRSIANNFICKSFKDKDELMWFGSMDGIFLNYNEEKDLFNNFQLPVSEMNLKNKSYIYSICEGPENRLFISLANVGIYSYQKIHNKFSRIESADFGKNYNFKNVLTMFYDEEDFLWLGTKNEGLIKIDLKKNTSEQFIHDPTKDTSISDNYVSFIFQDSRKILWIGTNDGLNRYDPHNFTFKKYLCGNNEDSKFKLSSIAEDKNNRLWIGSLNTGLIRLDVEPEKYIVIDSDQSDPDALSSNTIISLYSDNSNVLWIGDFNTGINKLDCERKKFYGLNNLVKEKKDNSELCVFSILKDHDNNILLSTDFEGLYKINTSNGESKKYLYKNEKVVNQTLICLLEDCSHDLWIGAHRYGLYKFNSLTGEYENFLYSDSLNENSVFSLCKYSNKSDEYLWVGTLSKGLFRFDKKKKEFTQYSELKNFNQQLSSSGIKCLLSDSDGILWIGTDQGGLNSLDIENGIITHYTYDKDDINSISDNYVICMYERDRDSIWVGTLNGGLNLFNKRNHSFKRFISPENFPDTTIRGILQDDSGNLWMSTNSGLSRYNPENKILRNYSVKDGLQSKEFNDGAFYKDNDGLFYFGGINGFNFFKPEDIKDNPYFPETVITDFQIFNHSVKNSPGNPFLRNSITETDQINLTYRESVFSFEFSSLIYNNSQKNQYAYMMEGFDKEWIYCGTRRFATYTSLDHGEYTFRVKSSNNDGIWNEEGTSIKIHITPPFWKTWWFKSLGVLSVAGTTGLAYQRKLMKVQNEKLMQEDFSRKLLSSQEEERKKIATELHHTIAHDVLVTKNKISIGLKNAKDSDKVKVILDEISDLASNTLKDVRSISHSLHPHQLESLGLTKAVKSIINTVSKSTEISLTASLENIDNIFSKELEINIFRIIQECFNNIIKHSHATEVSLNTFIKGDSVNIVISDNGVGFKRNADNAGIGMSEMNERIRLYGGQYRIDSEQGKGTIMTIIIPIKKYFHEKSE